MATYSWKSQASGDWNTATDWAGGVVPNAADADAVIDIPNATAEYVVTIAPTETITVASLILNTQGDGTNDPTGYKGATFEMDGKLILTGAGTIGGSLQSKLLTNGGTFVNVGNLAPLVEANGTVLFSGTNPFYVQNELQSFGTVTVDTSSIGELVTNTMTDGIYSVVGSDQGIPTLINLGGAAGGLKPGITKIQGPADQTAQFGFQGWTELQMEGPGSAINEWNGTAYVPVETTLNDIGPGGVLESLNNRGYATANAMTIESRGLMWVGGGSIVVGGGLTINQAAGTAVAGIFQGSGTVASAVVNNGIISALNGTLDIAGPLSGTGTVVFDKNYENYVQWGPTQGTITAGTAAATLELGSVSAGQTIVMGTGDTLILNTPSAFLGNIVAGNSGTIDLVGITATAESFNNGTVTFTNGTSQVAAIAVSGTTGVTFEVNGTVISQGSGGTSKPVTNDFFGDHHSDILWKDNAGDVVLWQMNGAQSVSQTLLGGGGGWSVAGTGDFNGDGKADLLWQSPGGTIVEWQMNGKQAQSSGAVGGGGGWTIDGTGDFNGDGKTDILWKGSDGSVVMWEMNGLQATQMAFIGGTGGDWSVVGSGDFNGDGKTDLLWQQKSTGATVLWQMNGAQVTSSALIGTASGWTIAGTGDFNGDGKSDILWQSPTGTVVEWEMNGSQVLASAALGGGGGWSVAGTGDFNGDGKTDILWKNAAGSTVAWQMNGLQAQSSAFVGGDSNWKVI